MNDSIRVPPPRLTTTIAPFSQVAASNRLDAGYYRTPEQKAYAALYAFEQWLQKNQRAVPPRVQTAFERIVEAEFK